MARLARIVVPGLPHHVTQRGNRRQKVFFRDEDYELYLRLLTEGCAEFHVAVWAYCLMPNHVHLIAVPSTKDALGVSLGRGHQRYTQRINEREGWTGHLWQGRFASYVMDEPHLWEAARYIEQNPVRAGLGKRPQDWRWSSARAHLAGTDDILVQSRPLLDRFGEWARYLAQGLSEDELAEVRRHENTGRPLGNDYFLNALEKKLQRPVKKRKPGPKR